MELEKRLSIVYVIPSVEISGGIYVAWEHATRLKMRGHDVTFAVMQGRDHRLAWLPRSDVPVISVEEIPRGVDALVATWWETAYAIADIPARAKFFLVQSIEPSFYPEKHSAEAILCSLAYRFDYNFISIARWLADWLKNTYKKEVCLVENQLNRDLFHPVEPLSPVISSLPAPGTCLCLRVRSERPTSIQVFWDEGEGFSDRENVFFHVAADWMEKCVLLTPAGMPKRIRIDTGTVPDNVVQFSSLRLTASDGAEADLLHTRYWTRNRDIASLRIENGLLSVASSGNDPFMILTVRRRMMRNTRPLARGGLRILVEGPSGIKFKGVDRALRIAMKTGCEVWFVEGKGDKIILDGICAHRHFCRVPIEKMRYLYSSCDILLKLSRVESFAYPPLEMMACGGIPVVGDVEGVHEYMVNEYNGFIVDTDNEEEIGRVLARVINDRDLRERIKKGCRETVLQHSCWDTQIDILERCIYAKVAGARNEPDTTSQSFILSDRELIDLYHVFMKRRDGYRARGEDVDPKE